MNTTINAIAFPNQMRGLSDGTVAGTRFFNDENGEAMEPAGVTVQQEDLNLVRIRFDRCYGIRSVVLGPNDTLTVNGRPVA